AVPSGGPGGPPAEAQTLHAGGAGAALAGHPERKDTATRADGSRASAVLNRLGPQACARRFGTLRGAKQKSQIVLRPVAADAEASVPAAPVTRKAGRGTAIFEAVWPCLVGARGVQYTT